jgi:uncharacterized membrane protein YesL
MSADKVTEGRGKGLVVMALACRSVLDGRTYAQLRRFARVVQLSVLWVLVALPLVTVVPATAAMFGVVRELSLGKEPELMRAFWRYFRENLRHALALEAVWLVVAAGVAVDVQIAPAMTALPALMVRMAAGVAALVVISSSVYALPLMVTYEMSFRRLLTASVLFAAGKPATTVKCLALVACAGMLSYLFPLAPLLIAALVAMSLYNWCARVFADVRVVGEVAVP